MTKPKTNVRRLRLDINVAWPNKYIYTLLNCCDRLRCNFGNDFFDERLRCNFFMIFLMRD